MSVLDHGAMGDGETDDIAAINAAVSVASSTGGIVHFPNTGRCYMVSSSIKYYSNITFEGHHSCIKVIPYAGKGFAIFSSAAETQEYRNINWRNLILDGNKNLIAPTNDLATGIRLVGISNAVLENLIVQNHRFEGMFIIGAGPEGSIGSSNIVIRNSRFTANVRNNIAVTHVSGLYIYDTEIDSAGPAEPGAGVDLEPDVASAQIGTVVLSGVTVHDNAGIGIYWQAPRSDLRQGTLRVINSNVYDNGRYGIAAYPSHSYAGIYLFNVQTRGHKSRAGTAAGVIVGNVGQCAIDRLESHEGKFAMQFWGRSCSMRDSVLDGAAGDLYVAPGAAMAVANTSFINRHVVGAYTVTNTTDLPSSQLIGCVSLLSVAPHLQPLPFWWLLSVCQALFSQQE